MGTVTIVCKCGCGRQKEVREADVKRGWGLYYSKSCKAKAQTRKRGGKKRFTFDTLANAFDRGSISEEYFAMVVLREYPEHISTLQREYFIDPIMYDDHPFSSEALGQD